MPMKFQNVSYDTRNMLHTSTVFEYFGESVYTVTFYISKIPLYLVNSAVLHLIESILSVIVWYMPLQLQCRRVNLSPSSSRFYCISYDVQYLPTPL